MRILAVLLVIPVLMCAQESIHFASAGGRVTDPTGAVIAGAVVTIRQPDTNLKLSQITDAEGRFRFPYLKPGFFELIVQHPGFAGAKRSLTLSAGSAFELPVTLELGAAETKVTVESQAAVLEAARSQVAGSISQAEVRNLPLNGRNFLDLALLVPGVSPTNTASTQLFAETSAVPGQGVSVNSQRNFSNSFIVDGLSANDDAAGLTGSFYGLDVVQEMQVVTAGGQAEFGRALGGYFNMITRSGTNTLHGDLYGYLRNQRLNAANALTGARTPLTQAQYGASLGGPIVRDRTFYFANFEQRELNQEGIIAITPSNADVINSQLKAVGYAGGLVSTGLYPNPVHNANLLGKIDRQFARGDQFTLRYSFYDVHSANSRGAGALNAVSAGAALDDIDSTIAAGNIATLSAHTVNETRAQFTYSSLDAPPNDPLGPTVSISGVATFGTLAGAPTARRNKLYEFVDNFSRQEGSHAFRAGVDFLYNDLTIVYPQSARGSYAFSSLGNFLKGAYNNSGFTQSFGNPVVQQRNPNVGFYAQDEWKIGSRLTLNLGVRYDLQFLKTIATDRNNLAPRAGFAWSPFASRRTVVRGSFGLFYDRVPLRALANALLSSGNTTDYTPSTFVTVSLSPTQTGAPMFPSILGGLPAGVLVNFSTMDRHLQNAYSTQGSFEVESQVGAHATLSAAYQHLHGLRLLASINQNVPFCAASGNNNGCRPNPDFGNNRQYSAAADSRYDALQVSFLERPSRWGSIRVSYTWSKSMDNVGEFFFSAPIDNFNIWRDWGRSDDDQRHRVAVDGTVHSHGFELSGILQYYSSLPLNAVTGASTIQGTAARPLLADGSFVPRNAASGFDFFQVSARLSRSFKIGERVRLQAIAESFNALNHRNNLIPNGTFGPGLYPVSPLPSFGQPTAASDPRTMQLALRLTF